MSFLQWGKTNIIFHFGALEKDKLPLSPTGKLMPPKAQFGVLPYRGQDKGDFSILNSGERDVTIEQINVSEDQMGCAFAKGARQS